MATIAFLSSTLDSAARRRSVIRYAARVESVVIAVFRARLREGVAEEFQVLGDKMTCLAKTMPGFISYKVYVSPDDERCSIIDFDSDVTLENWRRHPEHLVAQQMGRERFYEWYTLYVGEPGRESRFGS